MQAVTIKDISKGLKVSRVHTLYIVADDRPDERCILYVGQTRAGVSERLCQHVNGNWGHGPSKLGQLIVSNWPQSLAWKVQAYTWAEIIPAGAHGKSLLDEAEQKLIARFRPCLNILHNKQPRPLPVRYRSGQVRTLSPR